MNADALPKNAINHIQKIAPGPPIAIAVATPTMFPVPTRPEIAKEKAWKGVIPLSDFSPLNSKRTMSFM